MAEMLVQKQRLISLTIANAAAVSEQFSPDGARGLSVETGSAWTAANIGIEVSRDNGQTWIPVDKADGSRVVVSGIATAAAGLYIFPAEAMVVGVYPLARLVSLNTGTGANLNQGGTRTLVVGLLA
jgi:hypothetical protein